MVTRDKDSAMVTKDKDSGDVDGRSVFVRNLPYTLTDIQLQEVFSEVGPVRRTFTVKEKGSEQHRGFGFVQFAVVEDAIRAVEAKNGADLQGRKIKVELAKRRASFEERRSRKHQDGDSTKGEPDSSDTGLPQGVAQKVPLGVGESKKRKPMECGQVQEGEVGVEIHKKKKARQGAFVQVEGKNKGNRIQTFEEGKSSGKQRVARTVILGGLINPEMREEAIARAKKIGSVESVQSSLSAEELKGRCLGKDGCQMGAAAVVYTSVKAASLAVAALHQESIGGGMVWARQLGGEGSKPRKWRVIVRNLPFKVSEKEVRELFSSVGFAWEITIPRNADGQSKGFAFAGFTSKVDAEKAISTVNGKVVGKRPVAVDWAVAKKLYETAVPAADSAAIPEDVPKIDLSDIEDEDTASEGDEDELVRERENKQRISNDLSNGKPSMDGQRKQKQTQDDDYNSDGANEKLVGQCEDPNILHEMDMARRVLNKVASSSFGKGQICGRNDGASEVEESKKELNSPKDQEKELHSFPMQESAGKQKRPELRRRDIEDEGKAADKPEATHRGDLQKTVFIKNLPFEAEAEDIKKHFLAFGKVKSVFVVRHPITKRPKGTAFLEFVTDGAAEAAVAAGAKNKGEVVGGIMLSGRRLAVLMAVDKTAAQVLTKEKLEKDLVDRRNIYLAKEGKIEEGTPAADGISEEDMQKRKQLEGEKSSKLRSPNFHVSKTRLVVNNVPKSMTEVELRKLFIDAVRSRATKQHPVIKQVKILKDETKGGKSRGVAFVEFTEHQHALVALRMLNNNPETFSSERRPIVQFAIENLQTLKRREERQAEAGRNIKHEGKGSTTTKDTDNERRPMNVNKRKKDMMNKNSISTGAGELPSSKGRVNKKQFGENNFSGSENMILNNVNGTPGNYGSSLKNKKFKKQKASLWSSSRTSNEETSEGKKLPPLGGNVKLKKRSDTLKMDLPSKNGSGLEVSGTRQDRKRSSTNQPKQPKKKQRKRSSRPEVEDKLDKLVAEYRSKYFLNSSKGTKGSNTTSSSKASEDLKRWFE